MPGSAHVEESALASPLSYEGQRRSAPHTYVIHRILSCKLCVTERKIYSRCGQPRANVLPLPILRVLVLISRIICCVTKSSGCVRFISPAEIKIKTLVYIYIYIHIYVRGRLLAFKMHTSGRCKKFVLVTGDTQLMGVAAECE